MKWVIGISAFIFIVALLVYGFRLNIWNYIFLEGLWEMLSLPMFAFVIVFLPVSIIQFFHPNRKVAILAIVPFLLLVTVVVLACHY